MQLCSFVKRALTAALAVTSVLSSREAKANGRFPRGQQIVELPNNRMIMGATYGLVTTDDGGKNWYYVCETAFSFFPPPSTTDPGYNGDPLIALTADGSVLLNAQERITKSTSGGCDWTRSFEMPGVFVVDIASAPSNRNITVALTKNASGIQLYETTDGGTTWGTIGSPIAGVADVYTMDIDPKDPNHLMLTGITSYMPLVETGVFLNSTNHGMTWTSSPIPKTNLDAPPYIAAIHPNDPKIVFIRTDEWVENNVGGYDARDALLVTKDGGQTWTQLLRPMGPDGMGAKLMGFTVSPDGATVLAGFGDPVDGSGRTVDRTLTGIYKSSGPDFSFGASPTPSYVESITCLNWTAKGVYICGAPDGPTSTSYIGFASDPNNLTAAGITKVMIARNLSGKPACCAGRAVSTCHWSPWPNDCQRFDACGDGGTPPPPGPDAAVCIMTPDAGPDVRIDGDAPDMSTDGAGGSAGSAGASGGGAGGAGRGGAGTSGSGGASTGGSAGAGTGGSGGGNDCNCRLASTSRAHSPALGLLLALASVTGLRRSQRRPELSA